jgi:Ca2+-transporting ATPase
VFEADPEEDDVMRRRPRDPKEPLFGMKTLGIGLLEGSSVLVIVLAVFLVALFGWNDEKDAKALCFTTLVLANLGLIFANQSWTRPILSTIRTPNPALRWVFCGTLVFLGLALYVPFLRDVFHFSTMHVHDLVICLAGGFLSILWFEGIKLFRQQRELSGRSDLPGITP